MAIVWAVMYGLEMLSDVGIGPAIIRDKRGEEPRFFNTAWTLQILRGAVLWVGACTLAIPIARLYGEPQLGPLVAVAALTALIAGFNSSAVHILRRRMEFQRVTLLELSADVVATVATLAWAFIHPSVWALVGGSIIARIYISIASHTLLPDLRNRLSWDASSIRVLFNFGKWIYLSSAFHFAAVQADRLWLGYLVNMATLGVYSISVVLSEAIQGLTRKVTVGVLFPAYGKVVLNDVGQLRRIYYHARLSIDLVFVLPIGCMLIIGGWVVELLYDSRYHEAGWMFQLLCVKVLMASTLSTGEACLIALGRPQYAFMQSVARALWILIGIPVGWHSLGIEGLVLAVALSEVPVLLVVWTGLSRTGMLSVPKELRTLIFAGAGVLLGFGVMALTR